MDTNTVISFKSVATAYDSSGDVFSDVSFNINRGAFYFLTGLSGAGKTTLLKLIYQLHKPTSGEIKLFGKITKDLSRDDISALRHKIAIVFQEYSLLSHMTVFDNIALPLRVRSIPENQVEKLVFKTLDWVGLRKYAFSKPNTLSGGQQQRVSIARAIIIQPSILLADEPTGNLDDENASRLMDLFIEMNKSFGTTIILATHSQKLLNTYPFPIIKIENHKINFIEREKYINIPKMWKGSKPSQVFDELYKQFKDIGKGI